MADKIDPKSGQSLAKSGKKMETSVKKAKAGAKSKTLKPSKLLKAAKASKVVKTIKAARVSKKSVGKAVPLAKGARDAKVAKVVKVARASKATPAAKSAAKVHAKVSKAPKTRDLLKAEILADAVHPAPRNSSSRGKKDFSTVALKLIKSTAFQWKAGIAAGMLVATTVIWHAQSTDRPAPVQVAVNTQVAAETSTDAAQRAPAQAAAPSAATAPAAPNTAAAPVAPAAPSTASAPVSSAAPIAPANPITGANPVNPANSSNSPKTAQITAENATSKKTAATDPAASALQAAFQEALKLPLSERTAYWSQYLWGTANAREKLAALGEAPAISDSAPLLADHYDCTTFVETVAALARSGSPAEFYRNLIAIRYKDSVATFDHRNHFPEADWIPNNERAGIIRDITSMVASNAGFSAQVETKLIDRGTWLAQQLKQGKVSRAIASVAAPSFNGVVEAHVTYIPYAQLERASAKMPNGAVLNLVRASSDRHPVLISHQGFVVRQGNTVLLRHSSAGGNIRTVLLKDYLEKLSAEADRAGWKLLGINLDQVI